MANEYSTTQGKNQEGLMPYSMAVGDPQFAGEARRIMENRGIIPRNVNGNDVYIIGDGSVTIDPEGVVRTSNIGAEMFNHLVKTLEVKR